MTFNKFPVGVVHSKDDGDRTGVAGFGWGSFLLPHLQQKAIYKLLNSARWRFARCFKNGSLAESSRKPNCPMFRCPSDTGYFLNSDRPFSWHQIWRRGRGQVELHRQPWHAVRHACRQTLD